MVSYKALNTTAESRLPYTDYRIGQRDGGQARASRKSGLTDIRQRFGKIDGSQSRLVQESTIADALERSRQGRSPTVRNERVFVRQYNGIAVVARIIVSVARSDRHGGHRRTTAKCSLADACHGCGDGDGGQRRTTFSLSQKTQGSLLTWAWRATFVQVRAEAKLAWIMPNAAESLKEKNALLRMYVGRIVNCERC